MNGKAVLMPWRRQFRDQRQLLLVAEVAQMQFLDSRWDGKGRMRRVLELTACASTGVASAVDRMVATPRSVQLVIDCLHLALIAHKRF